jgi:hypothetical protein
MTQLLLYSAEYCLEYKKNPNDYKFELRVYQLGEIIEYFPASAEVREHMDHIVRATNVLKNNVERM